MQIHHWCKRLVTVKERAGRTRSPAFGDELGRTINPKLIKLALMDKLQAIK
jgi:hypothetical protein